ncbi:Nicotinamide N-methyltransferase [Willisornis vidua]|uniref:Nicotinamide N-methyltransferase n=1 Tax=Willisornis vidua TaxID=1566151 RepID=A0ABQ9DRN7_9PASS|nr:Nicotinamide N-methyltransferase [Willisornis vidua]
MEAPTIFTEADFYQQNFNPQAYLEEYYSMSEGKEWANVFLMQNLRSLHKMFSLDEVRGGTLIDVGCGPTIYQLLSACERFQEIIALDYTDQNRQELEKWLRNEEGAFDWVPVVKYVCELEGDRLVSYPLPPTMLAVQLQAQMLNNHRTFICLFVHFLAREKWAEKQEKVRKKVKQVLKCDVTKANPTGPVSLPPADCIVSTLCLEGACKDLPTFCSALRNIGTLVKPGGHLVMVTVLGDTFYAFNKQVFSSLSLQKHEVEAAVEGAGFEVKLSEAQPYTESTECMDCQGVLALVARRRPSDTA